MTVGDLKEALKDVDDSEEVIVVIDGDWFEISDSGVYDGKQALYVGENE